MVKLRSAMVRQKRNTINKVMCFLSCGQNIGTPEVQILIIQFWMLFQAKKKRNHRNPPKQCSSFKLSLKELAVGFVPRSLVPGEKKLELPARHLSCPMVVCARWLWCAIQFLLYQKWIWKVVNNSSYTLEFLINPVIADISCKKLLRRNLTVDFLCIILRLPRNHV